MRFSAFASFFAVAVASAAADVTPRYDVDNFSAYCVADGGLCYYDFQVRQHANGETIPTECDTSAKGDGALPSVSEGTCKRSSRTFAVIREDDGSLNFSVSQQITPISFTVGNHTISADQIEKKDGQETYVGPKSFGLYSS
ncbi:uncharacterized protein J4E78_010974 [Alternaria triticimaculans]|uniref:uncharacterized protein n=1 Tax=Alternaria triticimaculans TaxID=297637 RepID=UPI0020C257B1|nr:uncharacterized protein J4E78_010974 [Alternaria triticimaculans]KAI4639302.1 hypothetical protein J4E78_010974 [Alternaria triticimaculans]